jgi:2-methylisocitrate lyase-like PEP mutase family enzyme
VLPNVWDAVSGRAFAAAELPALATSSVAVAASLGYSDGEQTPPEEMFAAVARIARAVEVPVTADIEAGYGLASSELADRLLAAGAVGCNLADSDPRDMALEDSDKHERRIAELRAATGSDLVVNARVDVFLPGPDRPTDPDDAIAEAITRGTRLPRRGRRLRVSDRRPSRRCLRSGRRYGWSGQCPLHARRPDPG